ncbi:MAG: bifunctional adenosylcobinamide kinase/adenosylcobinamide-phosphate guanylyltransferase [Eubacteriales bacterium]|nr:bifunctional adenosylcobinamide kinase/adenosylcobinamide-phosphate guanylyltransferase [Eubacteriales bacterium]
MLALIIGGSGSGKSAFAEKLVSEVRTNGICPASIGEKPIMEAGAGGICPAPAAEKPVSEARAGGSGPDRLEKKPTMEAVADLVYLATMEPFGEEGHARIARHRAQRETLSFTTLECYTDLAEAPVPAGADVLLEDLSNLLANEMFSPAGAAAKAEKEEASGLYVRYGTHGTYGTDPDTAETIRTAKNAGIDIKRTDPALTAVRRGIEALNGKSRNLIIVTNEVFSGGSRYEGETLSFLKNLASLNREIASRADLVIEVVGGLPNVLKGKY